ncbi:P27 family phage terminase small subunit [Thermophilibacter provencensis]|uniref:P27 family phage terminase small subunit n=1 Tax=Thermophilibacter provencensis TaxID=1852386 RepID=UPI00294281DD|nr:P27 family phage terminase small subunit [Thermophilibacter provencensis]
MSNADSINAPAYITLPSEQEEFVRLAEQLSERGQYDAKLDEGTLARYVQAHRFYLAFTDRLNLAEQNDADSTELARLQRVQDSFFKQCRACAADLGLTVTARAKLSVPAQDDEEGYEL